MSNVYIYKFFFDGNKKVLSAWMKFTFDGIVRGIKFFDSELYAVVVFNGQVLLEKINLEEGYTDAGGFITYLDKRKSYVLESGENTITLDYVPSDDTEISVYTDNGLALSSSRVEDTVTLASPVDENTTVYVGIPYTMKYKFSNQLFKAQAGNTKSPSAAASMKIRNGSLFFHDTAYFKVKVTPKFRDTYENTFTPDVIGSSTLGELNLDEGHFRFPVFSDSRDTEIVIENDTALPSNFTSAEFESFTHSRSQRYAG